jgi:hypothetical protein
MLYKFAYRRCFDHVERYKRSPSGSLHGMELVMDAAVRGTYHPPGTYPVHAEVDISGTSFAFALSLTHL